MPSAIREVLAFIFQFFLFICSMFLITAPIGVATTFCFVGPEMFSETGGTRPLVEAQVCEAMFRVSRVPLPQELQLLKHQQDRASGLRKEADRIWNAIPVGTPIRQVLGGQSHAIGDNAKVEKLRAEARSIEEDVLPPLRRVAAERHASMLEGVAAGDIYRRYTQLAAKEASFRKQHGWYYDSLYTRVLLRVVGCVGAIGFLIALFFSISILRGEWPRRRKKCS